MSFHKDLNHGKLQERCNTIIENNIMRAPRQDIGNIPHTISQAIFDNLSEESDLVTQIDANTGKQTTRGEMRDRSIRCSLWLESQGISSDDIVVICTYNHLDMYIPIFATLFVEAVYSTWHHQVTLDSARYLMTLFKPKIIFACESVLNVLMEASNLENIDVKFVAFGHYPNALSLNDVLGQQLEARVDEFTPKNLKGSKEPVAIILSSGSSGFPKGVMLSSQSLLRSSCIDTLSIKSTIFLNYATINWISANLFLYRCIFHRAVRIIHTCRQVTFDDFCRVVQQFQVNYAFLPPAILLHIARSDDVSKYNPKSLKTILTAGSKIPDLIYKQIQTKIPDAMLIQSYGLTETGQPIFVQTKNRSSYDCFDRMLPNMEAKVINRTTDVALGSNEIGELCLKSPTMMLGYYGNKKATEEAIDKDGWLHSGDLCYYNQKGEIFLVERVKDVIKYRNRDIYPSEIEEILMRHAAVLEVAVVPVFHDVDGERPMAFVKIVPGMKVSEKEIVEMSSILGEDKKLSEGVKFLEELPKTVTTKLARVELKQLADNLRTNRT